MNRHAALVIIFTLAACNGAARVRGDAALDGTGGTGQDSDVLDGPDNDDTGSPDRRGSACGVGGTVGFPVSAFMPPVEHCHWEPQINVMSTPLVVDLDGDGKPEIVFNAFDGIHAIDGATCKDVWGTAAPRGHGAAVSDIAAGDLDGDGRPEIVSTDGQHIGIVSATGTLLAIADIGMGFAGGWQGPSIANVDATGPAEIIGGSGVFRYAAGKIETVWAVSEAQTSAPIAADLDGDGRLEVIASKTIYDGTTGARKLELGALAGYPAIAEFDPASAGPEIVLVDNAQGKTFVFAGLMAAAKGKLLFGPYSTGPGCGGGTLGGGGPPAVADFDGDGEPEIGVAGAAQYTVYDRECAATPRPDKCAEAGILWKKKTQDCSSHETTSTVFDFNCDARAEVVYRDECWLRVYEGATGKVLFASAITSNTGLEGAVVADTDGTGHAKIVICANDIPVCDGLPEADTGALFTGLRRGIYVLRDPMDRWSPTRRVWNQNAYHVTNVNEDGTIPETEKPSWTGENTYRANATSR